MSFFIGEKSHIVLCSTYNGMIRRENGYCNVKNFVV